MEIFSIYSFPVGYAVVTRSFSFLNFTVAESIKVSFSYFCKVGFVLFKRRAIAPARINPGIIMYVQKSKQGCLIINLILIFTKENIFLYK